jgi:glycerol-3-phosphate dehydrogenase
MIITKALEDRKRNIQDAVKTEWDFIIIGSGITGAQTFRILSSNGFSVLLIDSGDFSSGSSSNSGMLIWGGLLYLKSLDFKTVFKLSSVRDHLIEMDKENIKPLGVDYQLNKNDLLIKSGLWFYWLVSLCRRTPPHGYKNSKEKNIFAKQYEYHNIFEEALIKSSDSRYTINIIIASLKKNLKTRAFNYLGLAQGKFHHSRWELLLKDSLLQQEISVTGKNVINCAGIKVDEVNEFLNIQGSPYRHLWSKGVYLNLKRKEKHNRMFIYDDPEQDDVITYCPVGDVSLFGPTEENVDNNREYAFQLTEKDVQTLKRKYIACTGERLKREDVVSYRVGVRSLCVPRDYYSDKYTLSISRWSKIFHDPKCNYAAVYGGKFTGSYELAKNVLKQFRVNGVSEEKGIMPYWQAGQNGTEYIDPQSAIHNEQCWTLKDYLRNRTFIHQSVANGGFGLNFEFEENLAQLSSYFLNELGSTDVTMTAYLSEQQKLNKFFKEQIGEN